MKLNVGIKNFKKGCNINDIVVPEKLRIRHKTGFALFDECLGGDGMVPTSVMMLTGVAGGGKSTMLRQVADAITASGNIALYNTGEESLYQVAMASERLKLKSGFIPGQETMAKELLNYADNIRKANPKKQLFILQDSLQTLDDGKYIDKDGNSRGTNSNTPVRCAEMIVDYCQDTYSIGIFIGQVTKGGEFAGKNTIKHVIDVHGHISYDEEKKSETYGERLFEVTKNRWGVSGKTFILGMAKNGLYEKGSFRKDARETDADDGEE
jgi:DNA repair protein RadA/Sms